MPVKPTKRRGYKPPQAKPFSSRGASGSGVHKKHRWTKLSLAYRKQNQFCEVCAHYGYVEAVRDCDHIIRTTDGGARYDTRNLMSLCKECHGFKTGKETHGLTIRFEYTEKMEKIPYDRTVIFNLFKNRFDGS